MHLKPYYQDDYCTIYHGDCMGILPELDRVDLVLTDPPYGIKLNTDSTRFSGGSDHQKKKRGKSGKVWSAIIGDDAPFDPTHLLQYGKHQIIFGLNCFPDKLKKGSALVWIKRNEMAYGTFNSDAEIAYFSRGHGVYCYKDLSLNSTTRHRMHPTEKPIGLMKWCIQQFPFPPELILDPYMGSGTTLVAAKQLGRKAIGIEISKEYCDVAIERLRQEPLFK